MNEDTSLLPVNGLALIRIFYLAQICQLRLQQENPNSKPLGKDVAHGIAILICIYR